MFSSLFWLITLPFRIVLWIVTLPWRLVKIAWHHKKATGGFLAIIIATALLHNPENHANWHTGWNGFLFYVLTGFANFFYGFWDSLGYCYNEIISIHEEDIFSFGFDIFIAVAKSIVYWILVYLLTPEAAALLATIIAAVLLTDRKGGAAKPAAPSGGHGGGGGHH